MSIITRSRAELVTLYEEQYDFLQTYSQLYDNGKKHFAKKIALTLRILLHDPSNPNAQSKSLLSQLNVKNITYFLDTAFDVQPSNLMTHTGLVFTRISDTHAEYLPSLGDSPIKPKWVNFKTWWEKTVIVDSKRRHISREKLIRTISDKEGGAHVDAEMEKFYADLTKGNSLGWIYKNEDKEEAVLGAELASIRQIAYEILRSLPSPESLRM